MSRYIILVLASIGLISTIPLRKDMFPFIKEGDNWTAENLLHLEVEDE